MKKYFILLFSFVLVLPIVFGLKLNLNYTLEDARIQEQSPSTSDGSGGYIGIEKSGGGYSEEGLMKWNLTGLPSNIYEIDAAMLNLYITHVGITTQTIRSYWIFDNYTWEESTVTWNNKPISGSREYTESDELTLTNADDEVWKEMNVTDILTSCLGLSNCSMYFDGNESSNWVSFNTKEGTTPQYLNITYSIDNSPPTYTINPVNGSNKTDTNVEFNVTWTDSQIGLDGWIFEHNQTGSYDNSSFNTTLPDNETFFNLLLTLTRGHTFVWKVYANDTYGNLNDTMPYNTFTVANTKPTISSVTVNDTTPADIDDIECVNGTVNDVDVDTITNYCSWYNDSIQTGETNCVLKSGNTTAGQTWHCISWVGDGFENSTNVTSNTASIATSFIPPIINWTNATTEDTGIDSAVTPTNNNSWVNLSVKFYDGNSDESWNVTFCSTQSFTGNNCTATTYCNTPNSINQIQSCIVNGTGLGGNYTFYAYIKDNNSQTAWATSNVFEINRPPISISQTSPGNDTWINVNQSILQCSSTDQDSDDINYTFYNGTSESNLQFLSNSSNTYNITSLAEGSIYWSCAPYDEHGLYGVNSTTRLLKIDTIKPTLQDEAVSDASFYTTQTATISVNCTDTGSNVSTVLYTVNYSTTYTNKSMSLVGNVYSDGTDYILGTAETYYLPFFWCTDNAGNTQNLSSILSFSTTLSPTGGGTTTTQSIINITEEIQSIGLCGDGICGEGETPYGCWQDCKFDLDTVLINCIFYSDKKCDWSKSWFVNGLMIMLIVVMVYVPYKNRQKIKKKKRS